MARIGTVGRTGASWSRTARQAGAAAGPVGSVEEIPPVRALVVLDGGRREAHASIVGDGSMRGGPRLGGLRRAIADRQRPDPQAVGLERTRAAAARYAETARQLA